MFYYLLTGATFDSVAAFQQAFKHTSFGDLDTEAARNAMGLYTVHPQIPDYDPALQTVVPASVEFKDGRAFQAYRIEQLPLSQEETIAILVTRYDTALTAYLDKVAAERRYDSRITCSLRAGYPGPYQAEGIAFATWMDTCLYTAYELLQQIQAGTAAIPTIEEFIASLPKLQWPARG